MSNLLLVDDDDFVRSALSRALNRTGGFTVIPAELFEKEIRLPVAVMTGQQIHADLRHRLQTYGIAAVFSKPVDVVLLADELQRVLDPKAVGRISGITLFGLLQLLEVERKSGLVKVEASEREGRLYFEEGTFVHAHTRVLDGLEAAYEILGWPDPAVEIFYKRRARQRTVHEPLQHVLMEAARLLDESARSRVQEEHDAPIAPREDLDADSILADVLKIDGAIGAALVQATNGAILGQVVVGRGLDMTRTAKIAQDLVQDALVMRLLGPGEDVFVHLVLDRERASLGMARQQLAKLARSSGH